MMKLKPSSQNFVNQLDLDNLRNSNANRLRIYARLREYAIKSQEMKIQTLSKHKTQLQWKTFA